MSKFIFLL